MVFEPRGRGGAPDPPGRREAFMKHKVVCIKSSHGVVGENEVEQAIEEVVSQGWRFMSLSSGGMGANCWVYLVFER